MAHEKVKRRASGREGGGGGGDLRCVLFVTQFTKSHFPTMLVEKRLNPDHKEFLGN
jgi:hypothetical protein